MLCHGKSRGVVAYAAQMLTNSTPETSPSFTDVDMGASAAGYTVHKIFGHAGEMIADGEGNKPEINPVIDPKRLCS